MAQAELNMDDYLAMVRRRLKVILVPLLIAPVAGYLISYLFSPQYTSQSMILVEGQKVPANYVSPVITADFTQRIATLQQEILSNKSLQPAIQSLGLVKQDEEPQLMADIRKNMTVTPLITSISIAASSTGKKPTAANTAPLPGFSMGYTDKSAIRAQKICGALTNLMLNENLKQRAETAKATTDFLGRQVEDAKRALDEQDKQLAAFKKQYMGELPTDADTNMRMLGALNSQLDATTQTLSRAQQDKQYAESNLAQQLQAWKRSQSSTNPETLQQQLTLLQAQLMQLQGRYTEDHPDVIKTKSDIAKVQARLDEINKLANAPASASGTPAASGDEPPEVKLTRLKIRQYETQIGESTADQKRLQASINKYEALKLTSPAVEEQWRALTRDYDTQQQSYRDLLAKKSSSDVATNMESEQEGEQMIVNTPANLPSDPSFPNRQLLAASGLGAGLLMGLLLAILLEFSDRSIRTEKDIAMAMDLPMLISLPWLGEEEAQPGSNGSGRRRFWGPKTASEDQEKVEV